VQQTKLVWFRAASGQAGIDPLLRIARDDDLECILRRWGPAHTLPLFDYSSISDPFAGADRYNVTLSDGEPVTLRDGTTVIDTRPTMIYWPPPAPYFYLQSPTFDMPTLVVATAIPDASTVAWRDMVITRGGTVSPARQTTVDLLVKGLKSDGLWPLIDRLWLRAEENEIGASGDLIALAQSTNVSNCGFGPDRGYVSADGIGFVNLNFNPATAVGRKYQRNSAFVGIWTLGGNARPNNIVFGQLSTPVGHTLMDVNDFDPHGGDLGPRTAYFGINDASTANWNFLYHDTQGFGFYAMNRSAQNLSQAFRNGIQIQFSSNPSAAPESSPFTICKGNIGGVDYFGSATIAIDCFGASLTIDQHAQLYNHLLGYMQGIGAV
jgi:hypothetical protein